MNNIIIVNILERIEGAPANVIPERIVPVNINIDNIMTYTTNAKMGGSDDFVVISTTCGGLITVVEKHDEFEKRLEECGVKINKTIPKVSVKLECNGNCECENDEKCGNKCKSSKKNKSCRCDGKCEENCGKAKKNKGRVKK